MNAKKIIVISVVTVLALLVVGGGIAFAQSTQPSWGWGMGGYGSGMMGGYDAQNGTPAPGYGMTLAPARSADGGHGVDMNAMHQWMSTAGAQSMHTTVLNDLAETLGLAPDELNAELTNGKTLTQIAEAQGISQVQLTAALETSMKAGLDKAVADGALTQAQADQMLRHMASRMDGNYAWMITRMVSIGGGLGPGGCHGNIAPQGNS